MAVHGERSDKPRWNAECSIMSALVYSCVCVGRLGLDECTALKQDGPVGIVGNYFLQLLANQTRCKHTNWLVEGADWM